MTLTTFRADFLPFSRPSISEAEIEAVAQVLRSGWITTGAKAAEFEAAFSAYTGAAGSVAVASGTGGMHLALHALGIGTGDEVITPSMTWVSTLNLIHLAGATPVFVDVDRDTLLVQPEAVAAALTPRTKLIVPVHYAGAPVDLQPLRSLAAEARVAIIEDAAHAVGTKYRGTRIGAGGTSIFSSHPIKNITTGEGGMVCSDDEELLARVRRLKFHGLGADAYDRATQTRAPGAEVLEPGYKYNLTDLAAVLGLGQLARVDEFIERRTELVGLYHELLAEVPEIEPLTVPPYPLRHAWHLFIVRLDIERAGVTRDRFMSDLKEMNIGTGLHFRPVHTHKYYRQQPGGSAALLPHTEWNGERICSLPLFPAMTDDDVRGTVAAIKQVLSSRRLG